VRLTLPPLLAVGAALILAGCGGGGGKGDGPVLGKQADEARDQPAAAAAPALVATKNTTRIPGADPVADAAGAAQAVFPARTPETRPQAVVLADGRDWHTGIAAAQLAAAPLRAPLLLTAGDDLPDASAAALDALQPTGAKAAGGAQVVRVGTRAGVEGLKTADVTGANPAALAAAVDRMQIEAVGRASATVVVAAQDHPEYAMPAAGWAAKAGAPVLWTGRDALPAETRAALRIHRRPRIFVLGPADAVSAAVLAQLRRLGTVTRIDGADPVASAIAFARDPDGWNVRDPGHGLVFASTRRPQDAAAAAPLSASGTYGPLLVLTDPGALPAPLQDYLLDIQPGYDPDPVRGVYNHGWVIGDEGALAGAVQARIDTLLEIQPVDTGGA
jgi:hypothetical protein